MAASTTTVMKNYANIDLGNLCVLYVPRDRMLFRIPRHHRVNLPNLSLVLLKCLHPRSTASCCFYASKESRASRLSNDK